MTKDPAIEGWEDYQSLAPCPVVDAHVHCFPDPLLKAIRDWFDRYAWPIKYRLPASELAGFLPARGLAGQVLLSYAHKPGVSGELNRFLAATVEANPASLGLAAVHPLDEDPAKVLATAWQYPGLVGAKLHLHVLGRPLDDSDFAPILAACTDQGRVLNVHAGKQPSSPGYGLDVTRICGIGQTQRVLESYPGLRLIIPHLGWDETDLYFGLLEKYPDLVLDTTMILAGYFPDVEVDPALLERYSDRIMYGTDFPHIPYDHTREVRHILGLGLSRSGLADILGRTAVRVFGFDPAILDGAEQAGQ